MGEIAAITGGSVGNTGIDCQPHEINLVSWLPDFPAVPQTEQLEKSEFGKILLRNETVRSNKDVEIARSVALQQDGTGQLVYERGWERPAEV